MAKKLFVSHPIFHQKYLIEKSLPQLLTFFILVSIYKKLFCMGTLEDKLLLKSPKRAIAPVDYSSTFTTALYKKFLFFIIRINGIPQKSGTSRCNFIIICSKAFVSHIAISKCFMCFLRKSTFLPEHTQPLSM